MSPFERLRGAHLTAHPALEDFVFSILSLLVIMVAIVAIVTPQQPQLALAVSAQAAVRDRIDVYGTLVDETGTPIPGATIQIKKGGAVLASATTATDGSWATWFVDKTRDYTIVVTYVQNGTTVTASQSVTMDPNMSWGIQITFTQPSSWVFVPLPGY